ncbi:hypothetical protein IAT40_005762 [Kwoniella sp. CBS 6097]
MPELYEHRCQFPGCTKINFGYYAVCHWCREAPCSEHDRSKHHHCKSLKNNRSKAETLKLRREVYAATTKRVVSANYSSQAYERKKGWFEDELRMMRPGHACAITLPEDVESSMEATKNSGFNYHFRATFDDGLEWFLRIRQSRGVRPPSEIAQAVIKSEITTLNLLNVHSIPVPRAYFPPNFDIPSPSQADAPPVDYFYYERLAGKPYDVHRKHFHWGLFDCSEAQLYHFIEHFARVQIQLSNLQLPYKMIRCLTTSSIDGSDKIEGKRTVDEYLWHLELKELVWNSKELGEIPDQVYIKHSDEKRDHLMVDEKNTVTGILDWE